MQGQIIATVDFGSDKLSASIGICGKDDIEIMGCTAITSKGLEKGLICDEEKCANSLSEVLKELEKQTNEKITSIYAGISSREIRISESFKMVMLKDNTVKSSDIKNAIRKAKQEAAISEEEEEVVDVIINFYKLDGKVIYDNIVGWNGTTLEINFSILIGNKKELNKYKNVIKDSGYNLKEFIVSIIAGKNIFLEGKNAMGLRALVDIGAGNSDYTIFRNGVLKYINSRSIGGKNITKDLSICGKYSMAQAEQIKKSFSGIYDTEYNDSKEPDIINIGSNSISKKLFYEVTKARLEEIIKYVNIDLKNTSFYEGLCSIIIYGDGIIYFDKIKSTIEEQINKKIIVADNKYLGMKKTLNITSLALLKEVFIRYSLFLDNSSSMPQDRRLRRVEYEKNDLDECSNDKNEQQSIINRVKKLLEGIFRGRN